MKVLNGYNFAITPFTVQVAVALSGIEWHLSLAQLMALEAAALMSFTVQNVLVDIPRKDFTPMETKHTLYGIPIVIDREMPDSQMELRLGDQVLYRIENLAIPCIMGNQK